MFLIPSLAENTPRIGVISSISGRVSAIQGQTITAKLPKASLGDICEIECDDHNNILAQVVSFNEDSIYLAPFSEVQGISPGNCVTRRNSKFNLNIPAENGGVVIDALGNILHRSSKLKKSQETPLDLFNAAPNPLLRKPVNQQLITGVKSIDALCSLGYGQRIGLFASAGVGKSTLLGMLARGAEVDISIIALTGERGREVGEFIEQGLGEEGLTKSIVVVATSDKPALQRSLAAITATSIAEYHRSQGKRVLLLVDSLTRMARAIRDVSLAAGEVPIRQGLTSSVYSELPKLIERAGNDETGSITAIYTLLDSSEFEPDPLAEEVKSLLDGHICLDSGIAAAGIRPAIDITRSISRCLNNLLSSEEISLRNTTMRILSKLKKEKDMLILGGTPDKELKACLAVEEDLNDFLNQGINSPISRDETHRGLKEIIQKYKNSL